MRIGFMLLIVAVTVAIWTQDTYQHPVPDASPDFWTDDLPKIVQALDKEYRKSQFMQENIAPILNKPENLKAIHDYVMGPKSEETEDVKQYGRKKRDLVSDITRLYNRHRRTSKQFGRR